MLQRLGNRVVFKDQQVVEESFTGQIGPTLYLVKWCVLLLAQCQVLVLDLLQPLCHGLLLAGAGDDRQGIDEQSDLLLDTLEFRRASRHGGTEAHGIVTRVALQQQQPGRL